MKLNRLSKVAIGVAAACGVYSAIGFWGVPAGLKWAASSPVSDILGRKVSIQEVKFNPWTLELSAKGVEMAGRDASDQPVSIGSLYTNMAGFSSLTRFGVVLDELKVDHVSGLLSIDENGKTNFQDIIDNINRRFPPTEEKSKEPFRFSLNNISLTNSDFHIVVPSHHVDEKLTEINLGLPFIGSIGTDRDIYVKPELTLKDNGTPFELHGESLPFKNTKATRVHLALDGYDLPHLGAMLPLDMDVTSGTLKLNADITFAQGVDGGKNTILVDFTGNADDFAAAMRGSEAKTNAIAFKSLKIDQGSVDVIGRTATVNGITLESPTIALERLADGSIAWAKVAGTSDKAEPPKTDDAKADEKKPEDTTPAFAWTVKNAAITDGTLRFIDHAAHDARIDASALNATAENVTMIPGQTTNFDLSAKILDGSEWVRIKDAESDEWGTEPVIGGTGSNIEFDYKPATEYRDGSRFGRIEITFHNNTCTHVVLVSQGLGPVEIEGRKWHMTNVEYCGTDTANPLLEGAMFKFGNSTDAIASSNNLKDGYGFDIPCYDKTFDVYNASGGKSSKTFKAIAAYRTGFSDAGMKKDGDKACHVATAEDWKSLLNPTQFIRYYGILYGDECDHTLDANTVTNTYTSVGEERGMRGCFVYDTKTQRHLFFPVGNTGYGRRKHKDQTATNTPLRGNGVLKYANRAEEMDEATAIGMPCFYDLYTSTGALYYYGLRSLKAGKSPTSTNDNDFDYGFDINYFTFGFESYQTNVMFLDGNTSSNLSSDAAFLRRVDD